MTKEKALQILLETALLAQSKGILSLDDAVVVHSAISVFTSKDVDSIKEEVIT